MNNANKQILGLSLVGEIAGHRSISGTSKNGDPYVLNFMGIQKPVNDGYEGQFEVVDVQLNDSILRENPLSDIAPTFLAAIDKLKGKTVSVSVYVRAYPARGGASFSYNVNNMGKDTIRELK